MVSVLDSFNPPGYSVLCRMLERVPVLHLLSDRCQNFELEVCRRIKLLIGPLAQLGTNRRTIGRHIQTRASAHNAEAK